MAVPQGYKHAGWRNIKWTDAQFDRVLGIIRDNPGKTERWIFANLIGKDLPGRQAVAHRRLKDPAFLSKSKAITAGRPKYIPPVVSGKMEAAWRARRKPITARQARRAVFMPNGLLRKGLLDVEVYAIADKAVSRQLEPDRRDDARSDLIIALLSGDVQPGKIKSSARGFEILAKRLHPRLSFSSLDRTVNYDDATMLVDTFTTDDCIYEAVF